MKKIILALALMLAVVTAQASNTLYFTYNQALRTVTLLNNQSELMIYCGYADELPTYVLLNEVWAEQISSSFYEIWIYGYDAYTGEEVYMPIDLECIWLVSQGQIYSAAQTLRFRTSHARPTFLWAMPPYNPFVRAPRPVNFYYTYHYDIHRPGWRYSLYPNVHYHPYYMRPPSRPAPIPSKPFTPGKEKPGYRTTTSPNGEVGYEYIPTNTTGNITDSRSKTIVQNDPTSRSGNRITTDRSNGTVTTTDRITGSRSTVAAPTVTSGDQSSSSRGSGTNNNNGSRSNGNSRSTSTTNGGNSGRSTNTGTTTQSNNSRGTNNNNTGRSTTTTSQDNKRGTTNGTSTNGTSRTTTNNNNSRGTSTNTTSRSTNNSSTSRSTNSSSNSSATRSTNSTTSRSTSTNGNNSRGTTTTTNSNSRGNGNNNRTR